MSLCRWVPRSVGVLVVAGAAMTAQAADLGTIEQRGYIIIAVSPDASPFHTLTEGKASGFDGDLLAKLRQAAPFRVREQIVPMADLAAALRDGAVDAAAISVEVTPDWQEKVATVEPVAETTPHYLVRKSAAKVPSLAELGGKPLGYLQGSAGFASLTELEHYLAHAGATLGEATAYDSYDEAYRDLAAGRIDYIFGPMADLDVLALRHADDVAIGDAVGERRYAAWAVAKGNDSVATYLDAFLATERANGDLAALQQKWLGATVADLPDHVTAKGWWAARSDRKPLPVQTHLEPD